MSFFETKRGRLEIRELRTMDEMSEAEVIQTRVWGADIYPHPKEMLIPVQHEGGLLAGTFTEQGEMIGLLFSFPTRDPKAAHSQMLATLEDWRGLGIGARMKWFQRDWYLDRGINQVRWTVDPLRAANAELNIRHLGGICATYMTDYYGIMQGIDGGTATDRLLVEWQLDSTRVAQHAKTAPLDQGFPGITNANPGVGDEPGEENLDLSDPQILIRLPGNFIRMTQENPELASQWRMRTRKVFMTYFAKGYQIMAFTRIGGPAYLLSKEPIG
jgi:chorismate synthase